MYMLEMETGKKIKYYAVPPFYSVLQYQQAVDFVKLPDFCFSLTLFLVFLSLSAAVIIGPSKQKLVITDNP